MNNTVPSRIYKMLISACVAGLLSGLLAINGGANWKAAALSGAVLFLKDVQAYLSNSPGTPQ